MKKYNWRKIVWIGVLFIACTALFVCTLHAWSKEEVITVGSVLSAIVIDYGVIMLIGAMFHLFKIKNDEKSNSIH